MLEVNTFISIKKKTIKAFEAYVLPEVFA